MFMTEIVMGHCKKCCWMGFMLKKGRIVRFQLIVNVPCVHAGMVTKQKRKNTKNIFENIKLIVLCALMQIKGILLNLRSKVISKGSSSAYKYSTLNCATLFLIEHRTYVIAHIGLLTLLKGTATVVLSVTFFFFFCRITLENVQKL